MVISFFARRSGRAATTFWLTSTDGRPVRLHADRVDHGIRAPAGGQVAHRVADVVDLAQVERRTPRARARLQPASTQVDADHLADAAVQGDAARHVADRAQAEHEEGALRLGVGVRDRLPRGRQHVGQVDEPVVGRARGAP